MTKWLVSIFWLAAIVVISWISIDRIPPQHNPFEPLSIDHPLGLATRGKLAHFKREPDNCFGFLDLNEIDYTRKKDSEPGQDCGLYNALVLDQSLLPYSGTLTMTCPLTSGLVLLERQSLVLRAKEHFESPLAQVLSYGTHNCRRMYGRDTGKFSEHATANAIDIRGFVLADGTRITLKSDWGNDSDAGRFLKDVRNDACKIFGTVLGPDYNDAHADHFHLDMSQTGVCD